MHERALGAITAEDLAFERELQAMTETSEPDIEAGPALLTLKKEKGDLKLLSDFVDDYTPAKDHGELLEQVHMAKEYGADSIEAEPKVIRQLTLKSGYPTETGYLWYHDVKVWIPGMYAKTDQQSIESKIFGHSKTAIRPVMDLGEKQK